MRILVFSIFHFILSNAVYSNGIGNSIESSFLSENSTRLKSDIYLESLGLESQMSDVPICLVSNYVIRTTAGPGGSLPCGDITIPGTGLTASIENEVYEGTYEGEDAVILKRSQYVEGAFSSANYFVYPTDCIGGFFVATCTESLETGLLCVSGSNNFTLDNLVWSCDQNLNVCECSDCPQDGTPVCDQNGNTYGNACLAECAGVTDYYYGGCIVSGDCTRESFICQLSDGQCQLPFGDITYSTAIYQGSVVGVYRSISTEGSVVYVLDCSSFIDSDQCDFGGNCYLALIADPPSPDFDNFGQNVINNLVDEQIYWQTGQSIPECNTGLDCSSFSLFATTTQASCIGDDGSINTTVSGGTPPYTYNWTGGASGPDPSGLPAGNYSLTVTDATGECEVSDSFIVEQESPCGSFVASQNNEFDYPNSPTECEDLVIVGSGSFNNGCGFLDFTDYDVLTENGNPVIVVNFHTGDTGGFICSPGFFDWTETVTIPAAELEADSYTLRIEVLNGDPNIEDGTQSLLLTNYNIANCCDDLTISGTAVQASCGAENGIINTTTTGGDGNYTYAWSNGATSPSLNSLPGDTYFVTVTDGNSCLTTNSFTVPTEECPEALCPGEYLCYPWLRQEVDNYLANNPCSSNQSIQIVTAQNGFAPRIIIRTAAGSGGDVAEAFFKNDVYTCSGQLLFSCTRGEVTFTLCEEGTAENDEYNALSNFESRWNCSEGPLPCAPDCDEFSVMAVATNETCARNDGTISVQVTNGQAPITYSWSNNLTGNENVEDVPPGMYTVTVTDGNNCTATSTVNIAPAPCSLILDPGVVCGNDGEEYDSACEAVCAGVGYELGPCTDPCNGFEVYPTVTGVDCEGENASISLAIYGGTSPYNINWSGNLAGGTVQDGLSAGTYSVTVTDEEDCTYEETFEITNEPCGVSPIGPVCGADGFEYPSPCAADCAGVEWVAGSCDDLPCICPFIYDPVCGVDGVTYSNDCFAACAGVEIDTGDACPVPCFCPLIFDPVCGLDGTEYSNACFAECAGVEYITCSDEDSPCPNIYDPVCGADGVTYSNSCLAERAGVAWDIGPCVQIPACPCTQEYAPVCGSDGNSYSNACVAQCAGVFEFTPGLCEEPCICTQEVDPVCGADGITYTNACRAECAGVEYVPGDCNASCNCPTLVDPVCGSDGQTYLNACRAECAGVGYTAGECAFDCNCPAIYDPVCGDDGVTYQNICAAQCAGVGFTPGICEEEVPSCIALFDPVCANGITFSNSCFAEAAGYTSYTQGACFPNSDDLLCLPWLRDIVKDFGACGTTNFGAVCSQTVGYAIWEGQTVVSVRTSCTQEFNNSYEESIYTVNGELLDRCGQSVLALYCTPNLADGTIIEATEPIPIWNCGQALPDCYCSLEMTVATSSPDCDEDTGFVVLSATNGTPPYVYRLGESFSENGIFLNVPPGAYPARVTDAQGCRQETIIFLTAGELSTTTTVVRQPDCGVANGQLYFQSSGGVPPYRYSVNGSPFSTNSLFNGLEVGTATILTLDSENCSTQTFFALQCIPNGNDEEEANIFINPNRPDECTITTIDFFGRFATDCALNPVFSYNVSAGLIRADINTSTGSSPCNSPGNEWSDQFVPGYLDPGGYDVTVYVNGQLSAERRFIVRPCPPACDLEVVTSTEQPVCGQSNGAIFVTPVGGTPPYRYNFGQGYQSSDVWSGLAAGTYSFSVADAEGCAVTHSGLTLNNEGAATDASFDLATDGLSIVATYPNPEPEFRYEWSTNNEVIRDLTTLTYAYPAAGEFSLCLRVTGPCGTNQVCQMVAVTVNCSLSATLTTSPTICDESSGSIDLTISGGVLPYTYIWRTVEGANLAAMEDQQELPAGTYEVMVLDDNGCQITLNDIDIASSSVPVVGLTTVPASCRGNDGQAIYQVTGGTSPFTFDWSTDLPANQLPPGNYQLTVTDGNGCTSVSSAEITTSGESLSLSGTVTDASCTGGDGAINVSIDNANGGVVYVWSDGSFEQDRSNLSAGDYQLTVTSDEGCSATQSFSVGTDGGATLTASIGNANCGLANGSLTVTPAGGQSPYSYRWLDDPMLDQPTRTDLLPGTYQLTVVGLDGCSVTGSYEVVNDGGEPAEAGFTYTADALEYSFNDISTGVVDNYAWDFGDEESATSANPTHTYATDGVYQVCLTVTNSCGPALNCQTVVVGNGGSPWEIISDPAAGSSHLIVVQSSIEWGFSGQEVQPGDWIGLFYESEGNLIACDAQVWTGSNNLAIAAYPTGEDAETKNGFVPGEEFSWKLWRSATDEELELQATYFPAGDVIQGIPVEDEALFRSEGLSIAASFSDEICQQINLRDNFNLISTYIDVADRTLAEVLAPIETNLVLVKDATGEIYFPAFDINSIGDWSAQRAYRIKTDAPQGTVLEICGPSLLRQNVDVPLTTGLQWIPYINDVAEPPVVHMEPVNECIVTMKDDVGGSYVVPTNGEPFGTMVQMVPGRGYVLKARCDATFTPNGLTSDGPSTSQTITRAFQYFTRPPATTKDATLVLPQSILPPAWRPGDELAVVGNSDFVGGTVKVTAGNLGLTIWGNDSEVSAEVNGLLTGETLRLRHWSAAEGSLTDYQINVQGGSPTFGKDLILVADLLIRTETTSIQSLAEQYSWTLYPNPVAEVLYVRGARPQVRGEVNYRVVDTQGRGLRSGNLEFPSAGDPGIQVADLPSGVYFLELTTQTGSNLLRFIIR